MKTPASLSAALLLSLALSACGSGDERASAAADPAAEAPSPPPAIVVAEVDGTAAACPPEPGDTVMRVRADGPEYRFRLVRGADDEGAGTVDSIVVWRGCERVQALAPGEDEISPEMQVDRLSLVDLDFDGHGDLEFLTLMGMANSTSEYWRFDPAAGRFVPLGAFQTFEVDSARRELKTYVRGGHAGMLFTAARYRMQAGRPVMVWEESQDWSDRAQAYLRVVRELRGGAMTETSSDTLTEDEAAARMGGDG